MADESWGVQMARALRAVREMHSDASRLLLDLDRGLLGYKSVYGSFATMDLSYDIKRGMFMAEGLLRHWVESSAKDTVVAVNIAFWDETAKIIEPMFIAAKLLYLEPVPTTPDRSKAWDPWSAYLSWTTDRKPWELLEAAPPQKRADLLRVVTFAVPLSSITTEAHGRDLLNKVKEYDFNEAKQKNPDLPQ